MSIVLLFFPYALCRKGDSSTQRGGLYIMLVPLIHLLLIICVWRIQLLAECVVCSCSHHNKYKTFLFINGRMYSTRHPKIRTPERSNISGKWNNELVFIKIQLLCYVFQCCNALWLYLDIRGLLIFIIWTFNSVFVPWV